MPHRSRSRACKRHNRCNGLARASVLMAALLAVLLAVPARANVGPPVKVRLPRQTARPAIANRAATTTFEIVVGAPGVLDNFKADGDGWTVRSIDVKGPIPVQAGQIVPVNVQATSADPNNKLTLSFTFDGKPVRKSFTLSSERFARSQKPSPARVAGGRPTPRTVRQQSDSPVFSLGARTLRMRGQIVYTRADGVQVGADHLWFEIMDEDPLFDETMYSGYTNPDGTFDVTFFWDDCDILGCDEPDIYLRFETDNHIVNVQRSDLFEEDYSWSTQDHVYEDFAGTEIDFGIVTPADLAQHPAIHISNSIVRAHRFILEHDGIAVKEVDVQWPEDEDGAYYVPFFEEIHIGPNRQWNEVTHGHEYGHHYLYLYSINTEPDYCNGFCDIGGNCGHCLWCEENEQDAWNEGWPNWLGSVIARDYLPRYGMLPWVADPAAGEPRYLHENLLRCQEDNAFHDPLITEGFVGALLVDMDDATNDDHDNDGVFDCDIDAMTIPPQQIFAVARLDKPTTVLQFISAFRDRYPEHDQDLWSTTRNVALAYGFPLSPPVVTTITTGCRTYRAGDRVELNVSGNGSLLTYQWRRNLVNLSDGARITGTSTPALVIDPVVAGDTATYDCLVTTCNGQYSVPSLPLRVHVFAQPTPGLAALAFGRNDLGQTGRGTLCVGQCAAQPEPLDGLANVAQASVNRWHGHAVLADGTVWGWGDNRSYGQVGVGSQHGIIASPLPLSLDRAVMVKAGYHQGCALREDGSVWTWGYNGYGTLGVAGNHRATPVQVPGMSCIVAIEAGDYHMLALAADGTVWAWGYNVNGELGRGHFGGWTHEPMQVPGLTSVVQITAGGFHSLALKADGTVWTWGWNSQGQLGDGTMNSSASPLQVAGLSGATSVAAGSFHSLAILSGGSLRAWGENNGKLGNGQLSRSLVPVQPIGGTNVQMAAGGYYQTLFLKTDGTVWGCGGNHSGELGQTGNLVISTPVQIASLTSVQAVVAGGEASIVLLPGLPPTITAAPTGDTVFAGQSFGLSVTAGGSPVLSFAWRHNGLPLADLGAISGALSPLLNINPVGPMHTGEYTVTVTNAYGHATSPPAVLTVACFGPDLDCDGLVDATDGAILLDCASGPALPGPPPGCTMPHFIAADFDGDGDVDQADFAVFQRCQNRPGIALNVQCMP